MFGIATTEIRNLKTHLPYDQTPPYYPKVLKSTHNKHTSQCSLQHCTQSLWSWPRCPTAEGWWDDMWWTCHLPAIRKNELMSSAGKQVPLEIVTVRELSQSAKHAQHVLSCLWFLDFNSTHERCIQDMRVETKLNWRTKETNVGRAEKGGIRRQGVCVLCVLYILVWKCLYRTVL